MREGISGSPSPAVSWRPDCDSVRGSDSEAVAIDEAGDVGDVGRTTFAELVGPGDGMVGTDGGASTIRNIWC